MLPAVARRAIEIYSQPCETVFDPYCGTGTTLVEAAYRGRRALGIDSDPRNAELATRNIQHAADNGAPGSGYVWNAEPTKLPTSLFEHYEGRVSLVLTALPAAPSRRRHNAHQPCQPLAGDCHGGSAVRGPRDAKELMVTFSEVLRSSRQLMRPGGHIVVTTSAQRDRGHLIDFPAAVVSAGRLAGLTPVDRAVVLLARYDDTTADGPILKQQRELAQRASPRRSRALGISPALVTHQDLIVFGEHSSWTG